MDWLAEIFIQVVWEGLAELAFHKWGWAGGIIVFVTPLLVIGLFIAFLLLV